MKIRNITGIEKKLFIVCVKARVFFHFLPWLLTGKMRLSKYILFLKRLRYFISKMAHNKFVKIGNHTRVDLYCPGFLSKAFYTACKKFATFDGKLPCTTVLISVTSACRYKCKHCYQKHDVGKDVDINTLVKTVEKLQDQGIAFFNIEGGEPFLVYDRLRKVCEAIDDRSEIWINSTGDGVTLGRLQELKKMHVTAIMFSLHSPYPEEFNRFMGNENAWDTMEKAVQLCHQVGIAVAFNACLQKEDFFNGNFEKVMERVKGFEASIIQIIKPKPSGGWLETGVPSFGADGMQKLKEKVNRYNLDPEYCEYPSISVQAIEEDKTQFGCTAGGTDRFYINAKGDLQPCEFLNLSFGNIAIDDFDTIYQKMRHCFYTPGDCWLCEKYSAEIRRLFKENNLTSLPLPCKLSQEVYAQWDRGEPAEIYERIEKMG